MELSFLTDLLSPDKWNPYMDYSLLAILLLGIGLCLLVAEVFIPSGGLILILCIATLGASVWSAWLAWWDSYPAIWWSYLASLLVLLPTVLGSAFYILPRTPVGKRVLLQGPRLEDVTPPDWKPDVGGKVGLSGITVSLLNPAGAVEIDGERFDARSASGLIYPDQPVRVVALQQKVLIVVPSDQVEEEESLLVEQEPHNRITDRELDDLLAFPVPEGQLRTDLTETVWHPETRDTDEPGEPPLDFEIPNR